MRREGEETRQMMMGAHVQIARWREGNEYDQPADGLFDE
jgi:hypothetical protein